MTALTESGKTSTGTGSGAVRCLVPMETSAVADPAMVIHASRLAHNELKELVRSADPRYTVLAASVEFVEAVVYTDDKGVAHPGTTLMVFRAVPTRIPQKRKHRR